MKLRVGQSFVSVVDTTTVIVMKAPQDEVNLSCGGVEMVPKEHAGARTAEPDPVLMDGTVLGKRYVDEAGTVEVLCVSGGPGTLTFGGQVLAVQGAKPLPSSD